MSTVLNQNELSQDERPPYAVRRWTLDEYHALIEQGFFDDERVELLEGWIVPKMTRNPKYETTLTFVEEVLRPLLQPAMYMRLQQSITIGESEPEPDIAIVRGSAMDYRHRHPGGTDLLLVVEISDSSWRKDRQKIAIYASAEIPVYWIVDLNQKCVEVYTKPNKEISGTGHSPRRGILRIEPQRTENFPGCQ